MTIDKSKPIEYNQVTREEPNTMPCEKGKDMKIYREESLVSFKFWGGARSTFQYLTEEELEQIEEILEECDPDGMSETELNDFFWFYSDTIAEWLGYENFDEIMKRG